jgi:hypothetical protein
LLDNKLRLSLSAGEPSSTLQGPTLTELPKTIEEARDAEALLQDQPSDPSRAHVGPGGVVT